MKNLYLVTRNSGDGSSSIYATFDETLIMDMDNAFENGNPNFDYEKWSDGDGFHYSTWTLPDECTAKNVGFRELKRSDVSGL